MLFQCFNLLGYGINSLRHLFEDAASPFGLVSILLSVLILTVSYRFVLLPFLGSIGSDTVKKRKYKKDGVD